MLADISPQRVDKAACTSARPPLFVHPGCSSDRPVNLAALPSRVQLGVVGAKWKCNTMASCQVSKWEIWHFPFKILLVVISFCIQPAWRVTEPSLSFFKFFLLLFCFGTKCDNHYYMSKAEQLWLQRGKEKRKMHSEWGAIEKSKYTVWLVCLLSHNSPHSESIILLQSISNNCF